MHSISPTGQHHVVRLVTYGLTTCRARQIGWARENVALAQRNSADKLSRLDAGPQPQPRNSYFKPLNLTFQNPES